MTSRFQRNIKSNSYLVHYRPYQGTKKGKQVASSMKWGLVDNVVLRLMECLAPTVSFNLFMDNYFTFFRLFVCSPTWVLTTYEQEVCSRKIVYANILSSEINTCKKKKRGHFEQRSARLAKMLCNLCGWLERQQGAFHCFFCILPT